MVVAPTPRVHSKAFSSSWLLQLSFLTSYVQASGEMPAVANALKSPRAPYLPRLQMFTPNSFCQDAKLKLCDVPLSETSWHCVPRIVRVPYPFGVRSSVPQILECGECIVVEATWHFIVRIL